MAKCNTAAPNFSSQTHGGKNLDFVPYEGFLSGGHRSTEPSSKPRKIRATELSK